MSGPIPIIAGISEDADLRDVTITQCLQHAGVIARDEAFTTAIVLLCDDEGRMSLLQAGTANRLSRIGLCQRAAFIIMDESE